MTTATTPKRLAYDIFHPDRPGWIPEWVGDDWNPDPYAYQTREELMPAGRIHSYYLKRLIEMLGPVLDRLGLSLIVDVFVFYRDLEQRKQRIAPDLLIASGEEHQLPTGVRSYDLEFEPVPVCAIEIISPSSRDSDEQFKRVLCGALGIYEYVLLDLEDEHEHWREEIRLRLWRLEDGQQHEITPNAEGWITLESIGVRMRTQGRELQAQLVATGAPLWTSRTIIAALDSAEQRADSAEQRADSAEQELALLRAELERLRAGNT